LLLFLFLLCFRHVLDVIVVVVLIVVLVFVFLFVCSCSLLVMVLLLLLLLLLLSRAQTGHALAYMQVQGRTLKNLIISNSVRDARHYPRMDADGLYVFVSRVTTREGLRWLVDSPLTLRKYAALRRARSLSLWFAAYDADGRWQNELVDAPTRCRGRGRARNSAARPAVASPPPERGDTTITPAPAATGTISGASARRPPSSNTAAAHARGPTISRERPADSTARPSAAGASPASDAGPDAEARRQYRSYSNVFCPLIACAWGRHTADLRVEIHAVSAQVGVDIWDAAVAFLQQHRVHRHPHVLWTSSNYIHRKAQERLIGLRHNRVFSSQPIQMLLARCHDVYGSLPARPR
jgi:hypothetical protein